MTSTYVSRISCETNPTIPECRRTTLMWLILVQLNQLIPGPWPIWKYMLIMLINLSADLVICHASSDSKGNPPYWRCIQDSHYRPVDRVHYHICRREAILLERVARDVGGYEVSLGQENPSKSILANLRTALPAPSAPTNHSRVLALDVCMRVDRSYVH